jgi:hypothetical protein
MILALVGALMVSLAVVFCVRHFFVQLIALKLFIDTLILALVGLRKAEQLNFVAQASTWFLAAFSCMMFFMLMAAGTRRFSRSENLDLEADGE